MPDCMPSGIWDRKLATVAVSRAPRTRTLHHLADLVHVVADFADGGVLPFGGRGNGFGPDVRPLAAALAMAADLVPSARYAP